MLQRMKDEEWKMDDLSEILFRGNVLDQVGEVPLSPPSLGQFVFCIVSRETWCGGSEGQTLGNWRGLVHADGKGGVVDGCFCTRGGKFSDPDTQLSCKIFNLNRRSFSKAG